MKTLLAILSILVAGSSICSAQQSTSLTLMVSIDRINRNTHESISEDDAKEWLNKLNHTDLTMSLNYANSKVLQYIDYSGFAPDAPYFGVAIVEIEFNGIASANVLIGRLQASPFYTVYSNPGISEPKAPVQCDGLVEIVDSEVDKR